MPSRRRHALSPRTLSESAIAATCRRLLRRLGPSARGKFVAIETRTGKAYLGDTSLDAVEAGLRESPRAEFAIERLGYPAAVMLKGRR